MQRIQQKNQQLNQEKRVGLMTHVIVGYPSLAATEELIFTMIENGADYIELQIPFSDPIADGPTILKASQQALDQGIKIADAFQLVKNIRAKNNEIPLLFMGYSNTVLHLGVENFVAQSKAVGIDGFIIPDLPPEEPEGQQFLQACAEHKLAPILIFSPTSSQERLKLLSQHTKGLVYCVARTGVTGAETDFSADLETFLKRCRQMTDLPLAVGFGISKAEHVQFLKGKADIAVVGSATLRIVEEQGITVAGKFIKQLVEAGK